MYRISYWFAKKVCEFTAFTEQDRDGFIKTLEKCGIKILGVRYRLC